jgi:hypothetical protein
MRPHVLISPIKQPSVSPIRLTGARLRPLAARRARGMRSARTLSKIERARGRPGARRPHGPPATKKAGGSHHRFGRDIPAFPARSFTAYTWSPWCAGLVGHHPSCDAKHHHDVDTSVGVSGPHDFTVRAGSRSSGANLHVHRSPPPRIVTTRTSLCTRRDADD